MASQKREKEEEAYRRGYLQAVVEGLRLAEAAAEQHVDPACILDVLNSWEKQIAAWHGNTEETHSLAQPPKPFSSHLRLVKKDEEE